MQAPDAGTTTLVERPPPGPARGVVAAPVWLVALLSVGLALLAGLSLLATRRNRSRREHDA